MTIDTSPETAIELVGVAKSYGRQPAVRDLSFRIRKGTTFGFLGPNGAGKTTTIRMLMGLLPRDAGKISVLDLDPATDDIAIKQRAGYVPEQQFIYRWMQVSDAIHFCRSVYPRWDDKRCSELLRIFNLDAGKKVEALSKGMTVKLALLLAMSHEPEVLVLDEPMAGLDPLVREELLDGILKTACEQSPTILFSTHTLSDVQRMADTVGIMNEGQLLVSCSVDDLLRNTKRIRAVLKDGQAPSAPPVGTIWQHVDKREWQITVKDFSTDTVERLRTMNPLEQIEVLDLGLEDIFKDYVRGWRAAS